jgi:hypothetical protein
MNCLKVRVREMKSLSLRDLQVAGSTGLEPATSGVTGRSSLLRAKRYFSTT